jgi:glycosyltransferase involved in cell wall biosynthesis
MKVAIVASVLSHFEVPLFRLAAALPGLEVRVLHTDPSEDAFYDRDYQQVIDWGESLRGGYPNSYFPDIRALKHEMFAWRPDVVLQYGYYWPGAFQFLAESRLRRIPVVHRGLLTPYHNTRVRSIPAQAWRIVQPAFLRRFQGHHYGGTYSEAVLERAGIPKSQRYFVPFSIDTPFFAVRSDEPAQTAAAAELKRGLGWPADAPVLLFICQHSWFKAPDVMMQMTAEAQKRVPNLKLLMAGSGAMTEELKAYAAANLAPGSYHFPGYVVSKQTMPYYLAATLVLFPSRYDTWSRGVNEAMLARRACIVSRVVPAAGGLIDDRENGYVVDGLEPGPFVERIEDFLSLSPEARAAMGEAARTRAFEFSYEAHKDDLYRSLTEVAG